ncbi:MAG: serine/threonine protein kinase [Deltaproteobacteria bacterium]|nr:serine/threonine protein kinase [Deltaproteobacteria bacterium]
MAEPVTPRTFGPYLVERELGRGGMGVVYAATNEVFGGRAAIKVLLGEVSRDSTLVERFMNEARAASAIEHPSIVKVYDVGTTTDDAVYIVMELLQGESLASRLKTRGALPLATAIGLARQCANALEAAHKAGIVHRDLKPDNVFLVPDGEVTGGERVKLLDFGVAKLLGEGASSVARTVTGAILGTPHYMSPEQCEGAREVDARSDLYSLGCMLFQMVSGRLPFQSAGIGGLIGMHLHVAPPLLRSVRPDAPAELEALIGTLLEKDPTARIQTAADVVARLAQIPTTNQAIAVGIPAAPVAVVDAEMATVVSVVAPPKREARATQATQPTQATQRNRWLWPGLAAAMAAIAVVIVIVNARRSDAPSEPTVATTRPDLATVTPIAPPISPPVASRPGSASGSRTGQAEEHELAVGERMLRVDDFAGALAQAEVVLAKTPAEPSALALAAKARRGIAERAVARMSTDLTANKYAEVQRGHTEVYRRTEDADLRAAADRAWSKAKQRWSVEARSQIAVHIRNHRCDAVGALVRQLRPVVDLSAEVDRCTKQRKTDEREALHRAEQLRSAQYRMSHHLPQIILSGCVDMLRFDRSRVEWERCVLAQCELGPGRIPTLIIEAPANLVERLRNLCKKP